MEASQDGRPTAVRSSAAERRDGMRMAVGADGPGVDRAALSPTPFSFMQHCHAAPGTVLRMSIGLEDPDDLSR